MKKALVVDWFDKFGGAERVIATFEKIFSFDITYTLANTMDPDNLRKIYPKGTEPVKVSPLRLVGKNFRAFVFLFPYLISRFKVDKDVDLIISSSHAVAKGIRKSRPDQLHISYFQSYNLKYIWCDYQLYFGKFRHLAFPVIKLLRRIDLKQSANPDYIISNSIFIRDWVRDIYKRDSEVIYPPVELERFHLEVSKDDYYVVVGRIVKVKRFDIAVQAFNKLNRKLIVIGDGDQYQNLKKLANPNIVFTGFLNSEEVCRYISRAKAFIQPGLEAFGIAPIEAQACGTPVIAFGAGGVLETVVDSKTGVFFNEQSAESLIDAIARFDTVNFDPAAIRNHALKFSSERFETEIRDYVNRKLDEHHNGIKIK